MKALQHYKSIIRAVLFVGIVSGQSLVNEFGDVLPAPPPPALKISEVVKEQTFEHHVAARLRSSPPPITPAPAPGPTAGAAAPGASVYDLLPPEEKVAGVAGVAIPSAVAEGPQPLHNLTVTGDTVTQIDRPAPANASGPSDILWNVSASNDNTTALKAVQTFAPPAPVAFVSADGSLIFVGPSSPSANVGNSTAPVTHWLWPIIALLGLIGIVGSIAWAYSQRRQRRYLDLKDTEMAMQNRPHNPV